MSDQAKLEEARSRLPLKRLMEQYGDSPRGGGWKSFACPFCGKKGANVREWRGREFFKCWKADCSSGTSGPKGAWDEIAYVAHKSGVSRVEAFKAFLKMAGVWKEERLAPSILPGQRARKRPQPKLEEAPLSEVPTKTSKSALGSQPPLSEVPIETSESALRSQAPLSEVPTKTSESALRSQPPLLEVTSESGAGLPRAFGRPRSSNTPMLEAAAHVVTTERKCTVRWIQQRFQIGFRRAAEVVDELERIGVVGPIDGRERKILLSAEEVAQLFGGLPTGGGAKVPAAPSGAIPGAIDGSPAIPSATVEAESPPPIGGEGNGQHSSDSTSGTSSSPGDGPPSSGAGGEPPVLPTGGEPDLPEDDGATQTTQILEEFYKRLSPLSEAELDAQWAKRGLTPGTTRSLRSNPKSNVDILNALTEKFSMPALLSSGLWVQEYGKEAKPNAQFYGWGITGKKAKTSDGGHDFQWDWCHPVLIPYHDDRGLLTLIRPHKGMLRGHGAQLYIPEPLLANQREFGTAIICEGEFKTLAVLQVLGELIDPATGKAAFGTCSLPGITMSKRHGGGWRVRDELDRWLHASGARQVIVAFDNEEKGDPKLPGYKADVWKRHETMAWALYLADQLTRDGYSVRVLVLPKEWRDENGKADWDGGLAKFVKGDL